MDERTYRLDDLPERLASKIAIDPDTDCWEWTASRANGYGHIWWCGRYCSVHRLTYHLLVDQTVSLRPGRSGDSVVDHVVCDNKGCTNPAHLQHTDQRTNMARQGGSSRFVGVHWHAKAKRWRVEIWVEGGLVSCGLHVSESFAAEVYDAAAYIVNGKHPNHEHGRLGSGPSSDAELFAMRAIGHPRSLDEGDRLTGR